MTDNEIETTNEHKLLTTNEHKLLTTNGHKLLTTNGHEWTRMFMMSPLNTQKKQMPRRRADCISKDFKVKQNVDCQ